jgi:hypothetical protein
MAKKKNSPVEPAKPADDTKNSKNYTPAHDQAEKDIEKDPDLNSKPNKEDDLDEGELARLEGED